MAQVPAVPNTRRAAHLALLSVLGPERLLQRPGLAASERAALELRRARAGGPIPKPEEVVFLIPLVSPDHVGDWEAVTKRLARTLESFRAQDDTRWRAVICCQERPPLPDDPRLTHLPFDDPTPGNDKWRKLAALARHLGETQTRPAYAMSFDADDLLRAGTVGRMLARQAPGYLAWEGFVRDVATGHVARASSPSLRHPRQRPFWKLCGSCMALAHDPALPESAAFLGAMTQHEHRMFRYLARLAGLDPVPFARPSVLYELNHGENFGARRGRVGFKTRFVAKFRITDPDTLRDIIREFP
ncbi:hypothetical protein [Litorisediminicola beolgyonensis]|uniref:Glycosyl transferase family 2 n=1 Tax=Litorisediminicola beolgyonensis TaxID=1173614 RepID=A0ABW3ZGG5_9RHOB